MSAKIAAAISLLIMVAYFIIESSRTRITQLPIDSLLGALLLLSPVINPWYLVWVLPFATLKNCVWPWVKPLEFGMMFGAIVFYLGRKVYQVKLR